MSALVKRVLGIICPEDDPEYILSHPDEWGEVYCQNGIWIEMAHAVTQLVRNEALEEAARVADTGMLMPPDGGCPTQDEIDVAVRIAAAIRALKEGK